MGGNLGGAVELTSSTPTRISAATVTTIVMLVLLVFSAISFTLDGLSQPCGHQSLFQNTAVEQ